MASSSKSSPVQYFDFESDFVASLRCIPMIVRFKLDTCGVKLKLQHWNQFTQAERHQLATMNCETPETIDRYRATVQSWVQREAGQPAKELTIEPLPEWEQTQIPPSVLEKSQEQSISLTEQQWQGLTSLQRFALIKLSRSGHENRNFLPAAKEFGLT